MLLLVMICYMDIEALTVYLVQASVVPNGEKALFETPHPALFLVPFASAIWRISASSRWCGEVEGPACLSLLLQPELLAGEAN